MFLSFLTFLWVCLEHFCFSFSRIFSRKCILGSISDHVWNSKKNSFFLQLPEIFQFSIIILALKLKNLGVPDFRLQPGFSFFFVETAFVSLIQYRKKIPLSQFS